MSSKWPVFFCYRQDDGKELATWFFDKLNEEPVAGFWQDEALTKVQDEQPLLDVYFDVETPAGHSWEQIHGDALRTARALVVFATPLACVRHGNNDWVHKEIDWWIKNRASAAPIIIDTTGDGKRYIPEVVRLTWPGIQWIELTSDWVGNSKIPTEERQRVLRRVVAGITRSEPWVRSEQIVTLERLNNRNRLLISRLWAALAVVVSLLFLAGFLAIWARNSALVAHTATTKEKAAKNELKRKVDELRVANERTSALLDSERAERLKSQFLLSLINGETLPRLTQLASEMVQASGTSCVPELIEALSPKYSIDVVVLASHKLRSFGDPKCIAPLLRRLAELYNNEFEIVSRNPPDRNTQAYIERSRMVRFAINEVLAVYGKEGVPHFLDAWTSFRESSPNDPTRNGPGYFACFDDISSHLARIGVKSVPFLIVSLDEPGRKLLALKTLSRIGPGAKSATASIHALLSSEDDKIRFAAALALAKIGHSHEDTHVLLHQFESHLKERDVLAALTSMGSAAEPLARAIANNLIIAGESSSTGLKDRWIVPAISALEAIDPDNELAVNAFKLHLKGDSDAQLAAVRALGSCTNQAQFAIPVLIEELDAAFLNSRNLAIVSLGRLSTSSATAAKQISERITQSPRLGKEHFQALAVIGLRAQDAEGFLKAHIANENSVELRAEALMAFGKVSKFSDGNWQLIVEFMQHENDSLQAAARHALTSFCGNHSGAARKLAQKLEEDSEMALKFLATLEGVEIHDRSLHAVLLKLAKNSTVDEQARVLSMRALGGSHVAVNETFGELLALHNLPNDEGARVDSLLSLASRSDSVIPMIADHIRSNPEPRLISSLGQLGAKVGDIMSVLVSLARKEESLRPWILLAMSDCGAVARQAEPVLIEVVRSNKEVERRQAMKTLEKVGFRSLKAVDALLIHLSDEGNDQDEREIAGKALLGLDLDDLEPGVAIRLADRLTDRDWLVRKYARLALVRLDRACVGALIERLSDADPSSRRVILEIVILSSTIQARYQKDLLQMWEDPEFEVRKLATRAVMKLEFDAQQNASTADAISKAMETDSVELQVELLKAVARGRIESDALRRAVVAKVGSNDPQVSYWAKRANQRLDEAK